MKKISILFAGAAVLALASCSEEKYEGSGEGNIVLNTSVSTDMTVVSRAIEDDIKAGTMIWISRAEGGLVRRYNTLADVPTGAFPMLSGSYIAEAWAGDSVSASWDKRYFKGYTEFAVKGGETSEVNILCKIANVAAEVKYQDGLGNYLSDYTMTVGHRRGALDFTVEDAADGRRAYFMMPSNDKNLAWTFKGTQLNGDSFEQEGVIENAQPGHLYVLNVSYSTQSSDIGGAIVTIKIDDKVIEVNDNIELIAPPAFKGFDFDISKPVTAAKGEIGDRTVFISSAVDIVSVVLDSEELAGLDVMEGGTDVEIAAGSAAAIAALDEHGISCRYVAAVVGNEQKEKSLFRINFTEKFTNTLADGEHTFVISATDSKDQISTATLTFNVSDAPVASVPISPADYSSRKAILRGTVTKNDVESVGFRYRQAGAGEWQYVEGTPSSRAFELGAEFYAEITGLTPATAYEFVVASGDFETAAQTFTTGTEAQLANAGFEDWDTSDKTYLIHAPGGEMFWDSGNHGATTMPGAGSITTPDGDLKHSGNYSAKLYSKFVGLGSIGKFAAGNLFYGKYLKTDGTDGILGWGRAFTSRPTAVKLYAKYTPGIAVNKKGANADYIAEGQPDKGIIYVALTDEKTDTFDGVQWPFVIKTKAKDRKLFDKNDERVIAYGEHVFETATIGDGLIEITIPIDYFRKDVIPSNIVFVASASRYGDFFSGGEGSTMWVDDIELIYE